MTNPTLISADTTYTGMTVNQMVEEVLRSRGLTLDSTSTRRVLATTAEQNDVLLYLKRAHTLFNAVLPNAFSDRRKEGTWVADDHSILLPANCLVLLSFYLDGRLVYPITREDLRRGTKKDEDSASNMGFVQSSQLYWRVVGVADADLVANGGPGGGTPDYRHVLRVYAEDDNGIDAVPYVMDYIALGDNFASGGMPTVPAVIQEWIILRARELWCAGENDEVNKTLAMAERMDIEPAVWQVVDAMGDVPDRARWTFPALADQVRKSG